MLRVSIYALLLQACYGSTGCDRGWRGASCTELALDAPGAAIYPEGADLSKTVWEDRAYPWGGDCLLSDEDGLYHCFVAEFVDHCPMTYGSWYSSTHIRHAVSKSPLGPYTPLDVAIPRAAGNPVLLKRRTADGLYVMYFTLQHFEPAVRNCTGRNESSWDPPVYNLAFDAKKLLPMGVNVASAKSLNGPWTVRYELLKELLPDSTNPAAAMLPNGTVVLAYKTWPNATECTALIGSATCKAIGLVSAPSWNASYGHRPTGGAYVAVSADVEDPSLYIDPASGVLHMLLHVEGAGGSAHSFDNGSTWAFDDKLHSYEYPVALQDGTTLRLTNREEPKLLLDARGFPTHLINQAGVRTIAGTDAGGPPGSGMPPQGRKLTFVLMQPLNISS